MSFTAGCAGDWNRQPSGREDSGAWEITADFADCGTAFSLELLAIPFGGPCAGYSLLLTNPVADAHAKRARVYFETLMGRRGASGEAA